MMSKVVKKFVGKMAVVMLIYSSVSLQMGSSFPSETDVILNKLVEKGILNSSDTQEIRNEIGIIKQKEEQKKKDEENLKKEKEKLQMKIGGYTQLMYVMDPTLDKKEPLMIKRARISFSKVLNDWLSFKLQPDFAGIASDGNVALREAYVELIVPKMFARFRFGQYHQPFGFENNFSSSKKKVADTPFYMSKVLTSDYDYGIQWWGDLSILSWRIGIMNGTGSSKENNSKKDASGRILIYPLKELEIGISLYARNLNTDIDLNTLHLHYGSHLKVETKLPFPIFFTGEFVGGRNSTDSANVIDVITTLELKPFVDMKILSELAPVVRFEYWEPDIDNRGDEIKHLTFGLNFYPDKALRLLVDYTIKIKAQSENNNRLNVMLQVNY